MDIITHQLIDNELCGKPVMVENGKSRVEYTTTSRMAADDSGLVHGGFIFGLADYAAMLAVNDPNVVLGSAQSRFVKPVRQGDRVVARARTITSNGRKAEVRVEATVDETAVFEGTFTCFVLERHVLEEVGRT